MKKSFSLILSLVLFAFLAIPALAQNTHSISVKLLDATNDEPVGYATVSVTAKGATTPAKYTLTTDKGAATLDGLKNGTYEFRAELMGYKVFTQEVVIKDANVALGDIRMQIDQEVLDAASVTDFGAPVIIKKDTIEYNASAFKTTESDVLEDLLKKLPGVEVSDNGSVTVNGQTITRVYIDGKTFFMDDPQIATKNLPAKIINKVKVVEKKSEQAEFTGIDDGQEETVLDLSVQPGMMHGIIGNVTGGIGHDFPVSDGGQIQTLTQNYDDHRFQSNLFLGNFTDKLQISVIGNANNANAMGFGGGGGMGGGMMGGGMGGGMMGGGGAGGGGITTSYMLGGNIGTNLFDDRMELSGDYSFNGSDRESKSISSQRNYLLNNGTRSDLLKNTQNESSSHSTGHSISLRIEHEFSKNCSIIFQPQLSFNLSHSDSGQIFDSKTDYLNGTILNTNDGFSGNSSDTKSVNSSGMFMYRQRIILPGRTLTARINYNLSNSTSDGLNQSLTNTYLLGATTPNRSIVNQRNLQTNNNASINFQSTYTEPMGNHFYIEANYNFSWSMQNSEKKVFNSGPITGDFDKDHKTYEKTGETPDNDYSNQIINESINQTIGGNMLYQSDKLRAQVGVSLRPTRTHNSTTKSSYQMDTTFTVYNWSPQAMLQWDATDNLNIRFNYRGNSSQPSISQLMPVPDNSNPTRVSLGNPSLAPYFSHNINGDFRFNNRQKFSSINVRFNGGMTQSPIVNAIVTTNGVQHTIPFNGPNSYNGNVNLMMNLPIFSQKFTVNANTTASGNRSTSFTGNKIDITKYYKDGNVSDFNYPLFLADYKDIAHSSAFEKNATTTLNLSERVNFTWRGEDFDIRFGGSTNYQKSWYSIGANTTNTWRNTLNASATWNWELTGMSFDTDFRYNWYNGYTTAMDPEFLWNMEIEKMVFNNRATIALRAYDILGQTKNFSVTDNENYHSESLSNSLGRYIIVAFSWRFGTFGGRGGRGGGRGGRGGGPRGGGMPPMGGGGFPGGGGMRF